MTTPANCQKECSPARVSIHGGHSAEFCAHARDKLEAIIAAYIARGFSWVGITEHMPPVDDRFLFPDEIERGVTARDLYRQFERYMATCRSLQRKYARDIHIAVGFETETYTGAVPFVRQLISVFQPDYIVGSVHHVDDINFDFDARQYGRAAEAAGGPDALYSRYFDNQYRMINALKPAVVGHFDLIRIFDPDYRSRLDAPAVREKIIRNLACIKKLGLVLDLNVRSLYKGKDEPYVSRAILKRARKMGIAVIPGDDSHGVDSVGYGIREGVDLLRSMGFDTNWRLPGKRI